ncbi:MAG: sialidase family protein [Dongiaceae bacterium]
MIQARAAEHSIVYKDRFAYCAHPHIVAAANGDWLVVFNKAPRRDLVLHPPEDPQFQNVMIRSPDRGASWSAPQVVPSYDYWGTECAGLTVLNDDRVMLHQWRFAWYPLALARRLPDQSELTYPDRFMGGWLSSPEHETSRFRSTPPEQLTPWVRGPGKTFAHFSADHGASFTRSVEIRTTPFSGGYGMRSALQLPAGQIILPLSDVPNYRTVFVVTSWDGGDSWSQPRTVAQLRDCEFEEPSIVQTESGRIVMVLRDNGTRRLHQVESLDDGASWSAPRPLPIEGYPAHLLDLGEDGLLMTFGWRLPDFGIRAIRSRDEGQTWEMEGIIQIRGGLPGKNLGYPATIAPGDGTLFTVYYGEDTDLVTCIMATRWRL